MFIVANSYQEQISYSFNNDINLIIYFNQVFNRQKQNKLTDCIFINIEENKRMWSYHDVNRGQQQEQFEKVEDDVEYLPVNDDADITVEKKFISEKSNNKGQSVTLRIQQPSCSPFHNKSPPNLYSYSGHQNTNQSQYSQSPQLNITEPNQDGLSPLATYYQNHSHAQLVYKKDKIIGTHSIGQNHYWASVFATPQMIQKLNGKRLFGHNDHLNDTDKTTESNSSLKSTYTALKFSSDFQSGNLYAVYKVGQLQYDLILQNDTNTKGNTQWFYFRIINPPVNKNIKLNIVNLRKSQSLFTQGMLPCVHSIQNEKRTGHKWMRMGTEVKYFKNPHLVEGHSKKYYYTLSFIISTQYPNDIINIAQSFPYTYHQLNLWIDSLFQLNQNRSFLTKTDVVTKTLAGNKIQSLTIKETNLLQPQKNLHLQKKINQQTQNQQRPLILLLARQHPGQTPSSFIMQGLVEFLLTKQKDAEYLRKNFEIIVIPMLNPDGVQVGNYRTNLLGVDMNRRWDCTIKQVLNGKQYKQQAYEIVYIKRYLQSITKNRQVSYVIDLHGHSRKLHSFLYGNAYGQGSLQARMFPYICSRLSSMIKFEDCTFNIGEDKRSTARVQLFNMFKSPNIYTFEASFFGYAQKKEKHHFTVQDYRLLGQVIGKAMQVCERGKQSDVQTNDKGFWGRWGRQIKTISSIVDLNSNMQDAEGSDSSPEEFQIQQAQKEQLVMQFTNKVNDQQSLLSTKTLSFSNKHRQKITHREIILGRKQPLKGFRHMQVLDIAKINSVFPNDLLALAPTGFSLNNVSDIIRKRTNKKTIHNNHLQTKKNIKTQTPDCSLIKVYELCKSTEENQQMKNTSKSLTRTPHLQLLSISSTLFGQLQNQGHQLLTKNTQPIPITYTTQYPQKKSEFIFKPKSKNTLSDNTHKPNINPSMVTFTQAQRHLRNLSTLSVFRSKSIHQRQLFENARQFSGIKKSTDIRKNFKKVFTQFQLGVMMEQRGEMERKMKKNKTMVHEYVQTIITFSAGNEGISKTSQPQAYEIQQMMLQSAQSLQYTLRKCLQQQQIQQPYQPQFKCFRVSTENHQSSFQATHTPTPFKTKSFFHQHSQQQLTLSSQKQHQSLFRSKLYSASQKYWTVGDKRLEMGVKNSNSKYNKSVTHKKEFLKPSSKSRSILNKNDLRKGRLEGGNQQ